jgi:hypothetical protein
VRAETTEATGCLKGFTEAEYASLLDAARRQLGGAIVLVWDNLSTHVSKAMRELVAARDWLTALQGRLLLERAGEPLPRGSGDAQRDAVAVGGVPDLDHAVAAGRLYAVAAVAV